MMQDMIAMLADMVSDVVVRVTMKRIFLVRKAT
jgi:hypothetical protein